MSDQSSHQVPPVPEAQAGNSPTTKVSRNYVACRRCHAQKIKCNGEAPCRNCKVSKSPVDCIYPMRDRKITVSERYLRKLEGEDRALKRKASSQLSRNQEPLRPDSGGNEMQRHAHSAPTDFAASNDASFSPIEQQAIAEEGTETFLDEMSIQPTYVGEAACTTFGRKLRQLLLDTESAPPPPRPKYYKNIKLLRTSCSDCQLPNRSDAHLLVRVVLRFVGADYYLLRRKSFLERLDETYEVPTVDDPIWLCRLFTVFALGEVYSAHSSRLKGQGVPGTAFFLKAMECFQDLYEEPSVEYIETLVLLSFYSVTLNRRNTAYAYIGLALRLSLMLGLHRKMPDDNGMLPHEREHRIRVWWSVYCLDRLMSSKVGHPAMIQDDQIDTQLPSLDGLSQQDSLDFYDPAYLLAQINLSRITGTVLGSIYQIPQLRRANTFVQGVQKVLTNLRNFHENLPLLLKLNYSSSPLYANRTVASLHLHYNQCIILTTRPILFHVFQLEFKHLMNDGSEASPTISPMTLALAEACIQTARTSNRILGQLWVDGCLAMYGFYDALSIFSSTMVLMISSAMKKSEQNTDMDAIGTAWSLLRYMRDDGNVPARDYYEQLEQLERDLAEAKARRRPCPQQSHPNSTESNGLQLLLQATGTESTRANCNIGHPASAQYLALDSARTNEIITTSDALSDPFLYGFLSQPQPAWGAEAFDEHLLSSVNAEQQMWSFDLDHAGSR